MKASAILPIKGFPRAKTRLADVVGKPQRAALMKAMLTDVLAALDRASEVERIIVVTSEGRAQRVAMQQAKRLVTPIEVIQEEADRGHSEAAVLGIMRAKALGAQCAALVPGDCPLLDAGELDGALTTMAPGHVAVVPDRHGTGTNALLLAPPDAIGPAFGEGSCARHLDRAERAGLRATRCELDSLALDLDTPEDLAALRERLEREPQLAPATAQALAET